MSNKTKAAMVKAVPNRWFTFCILTLSGGIAFKLGSMKDMFYVPMQEFMGLTNTQIGGAMSAYGIVQTIGLIAGIYICDMFSKKYMIGGSLIGIGLVGFYLATFPPYWGFLAAFGVIAILAEVTYWPVLLKAIRLLGDEKTQGRMFGFLEMGRGVVDVIIAGTALAIFGAMGEGAAALRAGLIFLSCATIAAGVLCLIFVPNDEKRVGADGKKLSKRHGATSVEEYRDAGYLSDAFVNYLALLGWSLDGETTVIPRDVLASKFSLDRISKNPATFDPKKLDWMNAEYINAMDDKTFADEIMLPQLIEAGLIDEGFEADEAWVDALAAIVRPRTKMPADAATVAAPVFKTAETLEYDEKSVAKGLAKEGLGAVLDAAKTALEAVTDWTPENIDAALEPLPEALDVKKRLVFGAVRVAECGNMVSPPLGETMALIGRDDCLARIDRARPMAL